MSTPSKAVPPEMTDALNRINAAVPAIAATIQSLKDQISQSMTAAEVADVQSQLDSIATQLEGIVAPPEPPPVEKKK